VQQVANTYWQEYYISTCCFKFDKVAPKESHLRPRLQFYVLQVNFLKLKLTSRPKLQHIFHFKKKTHDGLCHSSDRYNTVHTQVCTHRHISPGATLNASVDPYLCSFLMTHYPRLNPTKVHSQVTLGSDGHKEKYLHFQCIYTRKGI